MNDLLVDLLQAPTDPGGPGPDLDLIRRRGRRLQHRRRVGVAGCALVAVAGIGTAAVFFAHGAGRPQVSPAAPLVRHTGISAYEKKVLRDVPSAYAVDGTVVLPDRAAAGETTSAGSRCSACGELVGRGPIGVNLGFDSTVGPGYLDSAKTNPAYQNNAPKGSQVVIDAGPAFVSCTPVRGAECATNVMARDTSGALYRLYGFGTERFLRPGAPMEVFLDDDWSEHQHRRTVIGGFAGTRATHVRLDLVDGSSTDATLARGTLRKDATVFWARTPSQVIRVRSYAADGSVLENHQVKACSGGVDCEVR